MKILVNVNSNDKVWQASNGPVLVVQCYGPVSVTSWRSIKTSEQVKLVFSKGAFFNLSYKEIRVSPK